MDCSQLLVNCQSVTDTMFDGEGSGVPTSHTQSLQEHHTQVESQGDKQQLPPVQQPQEEAGKVHQSTQVQEESPQGDWKHPQAPLGFLQRLCGDKQHPGEGETQGRLVKEGAKGEGRVVTAKGVSEKGAGGRGTAGAGAAGGRGGAGAGAGGGGAGAGHSSRQRIQLLKDRQPSVTMISTIRSVKIRELLDVPGYIYHRTSEWGLNFPEANGEGQSPINISSREAEYDGSLKDNPLSINYMVSRETDMCNNGHTVVIVPRYKPGDAGFRSDAMPKSTLRGGPLPVGQEYELAEFRFHWGRENERGSEHTVNFKAFPMELHLIHWNSSLYGCLEDALGKPQGVAIITLFIQIGRAHPGIKLLAEHLEDIQYKGRQKTLTTAFNPNCLLPDPMLRDYWTYEGSLTSPPCSEKVTWIIFRYPLTVCNTQIEEFRRLRTHYKGEDPPDSEDGPLVDNFRATQPLNDRTVRASFQ